VIAEGAETARPIGPDSPERLVRVTVALPVGLAGDEDEAEMLKSTRVTESTTA
jgi:hypothetical protein